MSEAQTDASFQHHIWIFSTKRNTRASLHSVEPSCRPYLILILGYDWPKMPPEFGFELSVPRRSRSILRTDILPRRNLGSRRKALTTHVSAFAGSLFSRKSAPCYRPTVERKAGASLSFFFKLLPLACFPRPPLPICRRYRRSHAPHRAFY